MNPILDSDGVTSNALQSSMPHLSMALGGVNSTSMGIGFSAFHDQQIQSLAENMQINFPPGQDIRDIIRLQFSFPTKLYNLLETADPSVVGWLANGKGFRVHDMDKFIKDILPQFFNHTKFSSFQRQLNIYGFKRVLSGLNLGAFFNADFQRGRIDLLSRIKRIVPSRNGSTNGSVDPRTGTGDRPSRMSSDLEPSFFLKRTFENAVGADYFPPSNSTSPTNSSRYNYSTDRSSRPRTEPTLATYFNQSQPFGIPQSLQISIPAPGDNCGLSSEPCFSSKTASTGRTSIESAHSVAFSDDGSVLLDSARPCPSVIPIPLAVNTPPSQPDVPVVPPLGLSSILAQPTSYYSATNSQPNTVPPSPVATTGALDNMPAPAAVIPEATRHSMQVDVFARPTRLPVPQPSVVEIQIDPAVLRQYGEVYYVPPGGGHPIRIKASFGAPPTVTGPPVSCTMPPLARSSQQSSQAPRRVQRAKSSGPDMCRTLGISRSQNDVAYFHAQASSTGSVMHASAGRQSLSPITAAPTSRSVSSTNDFLLDPTNAAAGGFGEETFLPLDLDEPLINSSRSGAGNVEQLPLSARAAASETDQRYFLNLPDDAEDDVEDLDEGNMSMEERDILRSLFAEMH